MNPWVFTSSQHRHRKMVTLSSANKPSNPHAQDPLYIQTNETYFAKPKDPHKNWTLQKTFLWALRKQAKSSLMVSSLSKTH